MPATAPSALEPLLQARGVVCRGHGPYSLELAADECLCLSGPSGSGKSLLLRALADLEVHEGTVALAGADSRSMPAPAWRRQVGLLPSQSEWWLARVREHFASGTDGAELEALALAARLWDSEVADLSTGERQRLALLRLLQGRPRVLLLDEPTASLDPEGVARMEAHVERYRREHGAAVLWVSHDPAQIERVADRHLRLDAGGVHPAPAP